MMTDEEFSRLLNGTLHHPFPGYLIVRRECLEATRLWPSRLMVTDEDMYIWAGVDVRFLHLSGLGKSHEWLKNQTARADRRDAGLMLQWMLAKQMRVSHPGDESGDFTAVLFPRFNRVIDVRCQ